jgi:ubiquinone/menaquinone biosynthesis C-methylase UbiE
MSSEHFNKEAENWDNNPEKTKRAKIFANEIVNCIQPSKEMNALEFGCGTGLLSFALKDYFNKIILVDYSEGMINVLIEKIKKQQIKNFKPLLIDLIKNPSKIEKTDVIFTLMTLHHIDNVEQISAIFHSLLNKNGYLCIADLVEEDGSFHPTSQNFTGHNGFNKLELTELLQNNGFKVIHYAICYEIEKNDKKYPLFLMIAKKV